MSKIIPTNKIDAIIKHIKEELSFHTFTLIDLCDKAEHNRDEAARRDHQANLHYQVAYHDGYIAAISDIRSWLKGNPTNLEKVAGVYEDE